MGKLWTTYNGNTLGVCVLSYFMDNVQDKEIKKVVELALDLSKSYKRDIEKIFNKESFPVPIGFTVDEDVNFEAPRLFDDEFYLYYLQYTVKAGLSLYSAAIPIVTRKDIREFFVRVEHETAKLAGILHDVLKAKGLLMNSPTMPNPKKVEFVNNQSFLNGYFGDKRSLHGLEIAHLFDNINNDVISKALVLAFSQGAQDQKIKKFLERGVKINQKHIEMLSKKLTDDNLPSPSLLDHLVTTSTTPPFSDKLMVAHKLDMFSMKIRAYANGASLNGRRDLGALYSRCILDVSLYVEDAANIMINQGWLEQPPIAVDREKLH